MKKIILAFALLAFMSPLLLAQVSKKLQGHNDYVNTVCFSPGGRYIASGGFDGTIKIWDSESGLVVKNINTNFKIYKLLFSGNADKIIAGTVSLNGISSAIDSFIVAFDLKDGLRIDKFCVNSRSPNFYIDETEDILKTISPDLQLDSCEFSYDYSLQKYSVKNCYKVIMNNYNLSEKTGKNYIGFNKIHLWTFNSPWALSQDRKSLVVSPENTKSPKQVVAHTNNIDEKFNQDEAGNIVYFYDIDKKSPVNKVRIVNSYQSNKNILISNDCKYFYYTAVEYLNDVIKVLDISKDEEVFSLNGGHKREILCLALHPGGDFLASGSRDNNIAIWDLKTGKLLKTLEGHRDNVNYLSFSPNGRFLASASDDKNVIIWDLAGISGEIKSYELDYDKANGNKKSQNEEQLFLQKNK